MLDVGHIGYAARRRIPQATTPQEGTPLTATVTSAYTAAHAEDGLVFDGHAFVRLDDIDSSYR